MRVATRVKEWVEPFLYRVVQIDSTWGPGQQYGFPLCSVGSLLRGIQNKSIHDSLRHLYLDAAILPSEGQIIFTPGSRITNLFFGCRPALHMDSLDALKFLTRLAIDVTALLEPLSLDSPHRLFRNVTYLQLLNRYSSAGPNTDALFSRLTLIPNLTHVAFKFTPFSPAFYDALRADKRLQCIALWSYQSHRSNVFAADSRLVCIATHMKSRLDWLHGADSGEDFWALADAFIAARLAGKVDRTQFVVKDTDTSWRS
ncbi:hypothetical protein DFH09DRAFT_1181221 [Mycena vulgaris]|nr:hypothetical protein DFH09DRAFT_1181221 [Mycena vulgaris]